MQRFSILSTYTITDEMVATLGRVLIYDNELSLNKTVSCASCHKQEFAFGDTAVVSKGIDGKLEELWAKSDWMN